MAFVAKRADVDGGLNEKEIFVTIAFDQNADQPDKIVWQILMNQGYDSDEYGYMVRLQDDSYGNSRWTGNVFFDRACPEPQTHPSVQAAEAERARQHNASQGDPPTKDPAHPEAGEQPHFPLPSLFDVHGATLFNIGSLIKDAEQSHTDHIISYKGIARVVYFNTLGKTAWNFMRDIYRLKTIDAAIQEAAHANCYGNIRDVANGTIAELVKHETFDIHLAEDDTDDHDFDTHEDSIRRVENAMFEAVLEGGIGDEMRSLEVFNNAEYALTHALGWEVQLFIASMAEILWPEKYLQTESAALRMVMQYHAGHILGLKTQAGDAATGDDDRTGTAITPDVKHLNPYDAQIFSRPSEALRWLYDSRRRLDIPEDVEDDYEEVEANIDDYVRRVYEAIAANPEPEEDADRAKFQGEMVERLVKEALSKFADNDQASEYVLAVANSLVKAVIKLHKKGDHFFLFQLAVQKADKIMTATARMNLIIEILQTTKTCVLHCLGGWDDIAKFVASPVCSEGRIYSNKKLNNNRKVQLKAGEQAMKPPGTNDQQPPKKKKQQGGMTGKRRQSLKDAGITSTPKKRAPRKSKAKQQEEEEVEADESPVPQKRSTRGRKVQTPQFVDDDGDDSDDDHPGEDSGSDFSANEAEENQEDEDMEE